MYKRTRIFLFTLPFMVLGLLCSCARETNETRTYPFEISVDEGQIFLHKPFSNRLGIYNSAEMRWEAISDQDAMFLSFGFGNEYPYFIFGQHGRLFHAMKIVGSAFRFAGYTLENTQQALAPFATDGELFLYLAEQVMEDGFIKQVVTISEEGDIALIANLDGMSVMDGVIAGDYLYFTCSIVDKGDNSIRYEVWRVNLTRDEPEQHPELIREDYSTYQIYQYQGKVLFLDLDEQVLYNDEVTIDLSQKAELIMIDEKANILVEQYINSESSLELAFTDILSGNLLGTFPNAINFTREGSVITIYGNGFIEYIDLRGED